jgi:hypothetical protein
MLVIIQFHSKMHGPYNIKKTSSFSEISLGSKISFDTI